MNEKQTTTKVLNGLFWKLMENGGAQGVQFMVSIILARLLSPEEYGDVYKRQTGTGISGN